MKFTKFPESTIKRAKPYLIQSMRMGNTKVNFLLLGQHCNLLYNLNCETMNDNRHVKRWFYYILCLELLPDSSVVTDGTKKFSFIWIENEEM